MGNNKRDRDRLHAFGEIMSELGLHADALDGLKPDEVAAQVRVAVDRLAEAGRPGDVMANEPDRLPLAGEIIEIAYLPAAKAAAWKREFLRGSREIEAKYKTLGEPLDEKKDAEEIEILGMEKKVDTTEFYGQMLARYLALDALPESANEAEITQAMGVAQTKAFFPGLGAMTKAMQTQIIASAALSPG